MSLLTNEEQEFRIKYLIDDIVNCGKLAFKMTEEQPDNKHIVRACIDRAVDDAACLEVEGLLNKAFEMYPKFKNSIEIYLSIYHAKRADKNYKGPSSWDACDCDGEEHESE